MDYESLHMFDFGSGCLDSYYAISESIDRLTEATKSDPIKFKILTAVVVPLVSAFMGAGFAVRFQKQSEEESNRERQRLALIKTIELNITNMSILMAFKEQILTPFSGTRAR